MSPTNEEQRATLWVDENKRAEYYHLKSRRLGQQVHELELELERVKRKSVARKRNLRSMQRALEDAYMKDKLHEKDDEIRSLRAMVHPIEQAMSQ